MTATVSTLLKGLSLSIGEGSPAFCSIERFASLTGVVYPGHDAPFRIGRTPEYVVRPEPLGFRGGSRAIFEETS